MKKVYLLFVLMMILVVAACGSENTEADVTDGSATESPDNSGDNEVSEDAAWPTDNVTMIVPFSAGGSTDRMARSLASHWEEMLDSSIIVENYGGSGGVLGAERFLNYPDHENVIFLGVQPTLSMNMLVHGAGFSLDDFTIVNIEQADYADILVRADSPYETLEELVEDARNNPGKLTFGTAAGSGTELFGIAFIEAFDLDVNVVTYDGGGDVRTALLGGHIDMGTGSAFGDMSLGEEIRVLTVASNEPFPGWPDAVPVNEVLEYGEIPEIGDNRFIAVHRKFAEENPVAFERLVETYRTTYESEAYQEHMASTDSDLISDYRGEEESMRIMMELHDVVDRYKDIMSGN